MLVMDLVVELQGVVEMTETTEEEIEASFRRPTLGSDCLQPRNGTAKMNMTRWGWDDGFGYESFYCRLLGTAKKKSIG